jgi:EAL domain-containing protein (putative c-di-GMP-specific phosphodiesterase class I)/GGDEF domain-containing protein
MIDSGTTMFNVSRMTMQRQLWLAIMVSMLLVLGGTLWASLVSARSYVSSQLSIKNTDNANSLALALSQQNPEPVMAQLLVASLFDSGHYELVRITDPQGVVMAQREDPMKELDAPVWFTRMLPLQSNPGVAQISSGWKQFGQVTLVSHSRFAYGALWLSAQQMILAVLVALALGLMLVTLVLRRLQQQLAMVTQQAKSIAERRFTPMSLPEVPELKDIAQAMNLMVNKLKLTFDEQGQMLEAIRHKANTDASTGLANRAYFLGQLSAAVSAADATGGTLVMARLVDLQLINARLGRADTDALIASFAAVFQQEAGQWRNALAGRLSGADFALLLPGHQLELEPFEQLYQKLLASVSPALPGLTCTWLVGAGFEPGATQASLLAQLDEVLASLEAKHQNGWQWLALPADHARPLSQQQWADSLNAALSGGRVKLQDFAVRNGQGVLLHREAVLRLQFSPDGPWEAAGKFWPMVERLHLTAGFDLAGVRLGLQQLESNPDLPGLAVNLSGHSIAQPGFLGALIFLLQQHAQAHRLWLEVNEDTAFADFEAMLTLSRKLKPMGCKLGIEHFGKSFHEIGRLQQLALDYLKVDLSFVRDIHHNPGNQHFLKGLLWIAHNMGVQVFAEGVKAPEELKVLNEMGIDGVTGVLIK